MIIKYIGHSCFKVMDSDTGYSIVLDPYEPGSVNGFGDIVDAASKVLCSHDHFDHNSAESVKIEPSDADPFEIRTIDTYHDEVKGAKRGPNRIYVIIDRKTGERLVHYGDIGEVLEDLLTEENRELLCGADMALIPVGGVYTYDAEEALDLIDATKPKITIPMHFRCESGGFGFGNIGSIEDFLTRAQKRGHEVRLAKVWFYDSSQNDLRDCILALRPENI
ncbi:MAG: Zn-dependent hydrolase [Clostridiales bacterium]|nr:Zn-dependent hydrolase [Clostridiales bacterium]